MTQKHTLLATIGTSPQVVTETLYAIHRENKPWPDEIFLITTSVGKNKIKELKFEEHLQRLCSEIQRPLPVFAESHILVTPGADGADVEDARSLEDHEALANFIMTTVRNHTADANTRLHASLAGGRKTMTFYIGYAMSLFGRQQDTLSHVLVSDGYEGNRNFWFPTQAEEHRHLKDTKGNPLDASTAEVTLADIPFLRHRDDLPEVLKTIAQADAAKIPINFRSLMCFFNLGQAKDNIQLIIDYATKKIEVSDKSKPDIKMDISFENNFIEFAYYTTFVRHGFNEKFSRPTKNTPDTHFLKFLLNEILAIKGLPAEENINDAFDIVEDNDFIDKRVIMSLRGVEIERTYFKKTNQKNNKRKNTEEEDYFETEIKKRNFGMTSSWFDDKKFNIKSIFSKNLPANLVRHLVPEKNGKNFRINLEPEQIHIIEGRAE